MNNRTPSRRRLLALAVATPMLLAACSTVAPSGDGGTDPAPAGSSAAPASSAPPYDASALRTPTGRMLGVASDGDPGDLASVTAFAAKAGRPADAREYYQVWGDDFDVAGNTALWKNGQLPILTLVPDSVTLTDIAGGAQDTYLTSFADQVRSYQGPLVLSFASEMNASWNGWGPGKATAADFIAAWKHVHDTFRDHGVTNVIWLWTPHVSDSAAQATLKPYFPGDDYVDWLGLVGYYGPQEGSDFKGLFAPTVKTLRSLSKKPLLITETGVAEGPKKTSQITDLFTGAANTDGLIGLVWFDLQKTWPGAKVATDWRIDSSPAAQAAVAKAAAAQNFGHPVK
ncbi:MULTISPECIES: glycoside hydrolase family 26 protein [Kitasatospora]|uniref:GH26 domain-containing protein n=2 Tax=Kitasatospora TaxID=2063 RepID=A0ABT1ITT7_9ACTN|nr:glycosyl hydrolase [Kitasatospora paracochleata]MCP2308550.1 hypothetical protein [Kitasatospora paracochleata]